MLNLRKAALVARFEITEALHSRALALLALLYGGGAVLGSSIFLSLLRAAENSAREALAAQTHQDPKSLPADLVREHAMPWLVQWVDDEATREQLLQMDPLSIFFGFASLQTVAIVVLLGATGSIARDIATGAVRFVLFRCDRLAWTVGKFAGQAVLLGAGLLLAAFATAITGMWIDESVEFGRLFWLIRTAFRSWIYGLAYLGLFMGVSMVASSPTKARAGAVLAWFLTSLGHSLVTADWFNQQLPGAKVVAWLFPAEHQMKLWSGHWTVYVGAVFMLLLFGAGTFLLGHRLFERKDA